MNSFSAWGRLTADPQVRESRAGHRYVRFCLASPRSRSGGSGGSGESGEPAFNLFDCWCFSPHVVQAIAACLRRGDHAFVAGEVEIEYLEGRGWRPRVIVRDIGTPKIGRPVATGPSAGSSPNPPASPTGSPVARMASREIDFGNPFDDPSGE